MIKKVLSVCLFGFSMMQIPNSSIASTLLSDECMSELRSVGENTIRQLDGRGEDVHVGIDLGGLKELPMRKHPIEKRLKYRVFETTGGTGDNDYTLQFTLSYTKSGTCFVYGLNVFHLLPYAQEDSEIKAHNANLK